jgi:hypothetical protein
MLKVAAFLMACMGSAFAQNCVKYGAPTTLSGTLSLKDQAGYIQFIVLKLVLPICTFTDPKDATDPSDEYYRGQSGVTEIQAGVYGVDGDPYALGDRLERLVGYRVVVKGDLFPATTGYHRTNVQLRVQAVEPVDGVGQQALLAPAMSFTPKDVAAYDVTINAGERLSIEAHESGSAIPLVPVDQYVPHSVTGGDVLYLDCREGYKRSLISNSEKGGGICFDELTCGLAAFPENLVVIKFRCTKKP